MSDLRRKILRLFEQMRTDTLDLHTLFEAGGNDPETRGRVIDVVFQMVQEGVLEERGSDFYALTAKSQATMKK